MGKIDLQESFFKGFAPNTDFVMIFKVEGVADACHNLGSIAQQPFTFDRGDPFSHKVECASIVTQLRHFVLLYTSSLNFGHIFLIIIFKVSDLIYRGIYD